MERREDMAKHISIKKIFSSITHQGKEKIVHLDIYTNNSVLEPKLTKRKIV
jgi:hypothetical protein